MTGVISHPGRANVRNITRGMRQAKVAVARLATTACIVRAPVVPIARIKCVRQVAGTALRDALRAISAAGVRSRAPPDVAPVTQTENAHRRPLLHLKNKDRLVSAISFCV